MCVAWLGQGWHYGRRAPEQAAHGADGRDRDGARRVLLPLYLDPFDVLEPYDEVQRHQAPASEARQPDVEPEHGELLARVVGVVRGDDDVRKLDVPGQRRGHHDPQQRRQLLEGVLEPRALPLAQRLVERGGVRAQRGELDLLVGLALGRWPFHLTNGGGGSAPGYRSEGR